MSDDARQPITRFDTLYGVKELKLEYVWRRRFDAHGNFEGWDYVMSSGVIHGGPEFPMQVGRLHEVEGIEG